MCYLIMLGWPNQVKAPDMKANLENWLGSCPIWVQIPVPAFLLVKIKRLSFLSVFVIFNYAKR